MIDAIIRRHSVIQHSNRPPNNLTYVTYRKPKLFLFCFVLFWVCPCPSLMHKVFASCMNPTVAVSGIFVQGLDFFWLKKQNEKKRTTERKKKRDSTTVDAFCRSVTFTNRDVYFQKI